jgi:hypothetical protein
VGPDLLIAKGAAEFFISFFFLSILEKVFLFGCWSSVKPSNNQLASRPDKTWSEAETLTSPLKSPLIEGFFLLRFFLKLNCVRH